MKQKSIRRWSITALCILLAGGLGFLCGRSPLHKTEQIRRILQQESYFAPDTEQLDEASARGIAQAVADDYTQYMTPEQMLALSAQVSKDETIGLGMEWIAQEDGYYVAEVQDASPAQIAGIVRGDRIRRIDGKQVGRDQPLPDLQLGQRLVLEVEHGGQTRKQPIFAAAIAPMEDVLGESLTDTVYYLRIRTFAQQGMEQQVRQRLSDLPQETHLILDLRGNPGGRMDAALSIAGLFVPKQTPLLTVCYAHERRETYHNADDSVWTGGKIAILIDGQSASAAEILAGVLQGYGKATLFGQTSYGKGTVQQIHTLSDGSGLRLTCALYELPDGRRIAEQGGITPDVAVEQGALPGWALEHEQDAVLQKALAWIQQKK